MVSLSNYSIPGGSIHLKRQTGTHHCSILPWIGWFENRWASSIYNNNHANLCASVYHTKDSYNLGCSNGHTLSCRQRKYPPAEGYQRSYRPIRISRGRPSTT